MKKGKTILELQSEIGTALQRLPELAAHLPDPLQPLMKLAPPKGARAQVSLRHGKAERQVKRNAPADSWSPDCGVVSISYDASPAKPAQAREPSAHSYPSPPQGYVEDPAEDPARDLLLALARAEREPELGFVSLKWFRDTYLPQQGYAWAADPENRQRVLADVINHRRWILTSKLPNPKHPRYPVTAIRVNRPLPDVRRILDREASLGSAFAPITIAGRPLSETVLRERR